MDLMGKGCLQPMNNFDNLNDIKKYLSSIGFKEYKPTPFDNHYICSRFQKRYDDETGKKYFIDAKIWDWSDTDKVPDNYRIEYECQLYQNGTHDAVNLTYIDWTIDQVEDFVNKMFENGMLDYYEKWEDD